MPTFWHDKSQKPIEMGILGPPELRTLLRGLYGNGWRRKSARVLGYSMRSISGWCDGTHPVPGKVLRQLLAYTEDRRRVEQHRKRLEAALAAEMAYRAEATAYAARWLRLAVSGQVEIPAQRRWRAEQGKQS